MNSPMFDGRNSALDVRKAERKPTTGGYAATAMIMQENPESRPMAHILNRGAVRSAG
jgi:hypothetical protein